MSGHPSPRFDTARLRMLPLAERRHRLSIEEIAVDPSPPGPVLPEAVAGQVRRCADRILRARAIGRPVIMAFGAHLIKNGLGPVVAWMVRQGHLTHVATNGAGSIHDWEFAYCGKSAEDVRANTAAGRFGTWDETGRCINLAVAIGGVDGLGYGESVGRLIAEEGLAAPDPEALRAGIAAAVAGPAPDAESAAAMADLLSLIQSGGVEPGSHSLPHPWHRFSLQYAAYATGIPFTVHPGLGYDIIHTHPLVSGGALGRGAIRDFYAYVHSVSNLTDGVHIAVGSSVMAPMIFEKALSMANNAAIAEGRPTVAGHYLVVTDIQDGGGWDWSSGEPPMDHPAYYLRFCKTFYRMGGALDYIQLENVLFLKALAAELARESR